MILWLALLGCHEPERAPTFLLARHPEAVVSLTLPPGSRTSPIADTLPLAGFTRVEQPDARFVRYVAPLPFSWIDGGFGRTRPPDGLVLRHPGKLSWDPEDGPGRWRTLNGDLIVDLPPGSPAPTPDDWAMSYPPGAALERALNLGESGLSPEAFALGSRIGATQGGFGVLLPAPAEATWEVAIPDGAALSFDARILPGAVPDAATPDGAELAIELLRGERVLERRTRRLEADAGWQIVKLGLQKYAGETLRIRISTAPGGGASQDYVFVREPAVYVPTRTPRHLALVFVDTLRRDHLGVYGYDVRPTTPRIDDWSRRAVVFEDTRSVSPWTLPATRAILTGHQPEAFGSVPNLADRLAAEGFATGAFVSNAFLTEGFGMADGWGWYDFDFMSDADDQLEQASEFLALHQDRDAVVLVHLMDTHLPWREPPAYRTLWAKDAPAPALADTFSRADVVAHDVKRMRPALRDYLLARYDQTIRYVDDTLGDFLDAHAASTSVMLFSDHGEEFWDHGGFEHGHAVWDELLRVPLIVSSPGLPAGRVPEPVSVLDITPTALDLLGVPHDDLPGPGLLDAAAGLPRAVGALRRRPLAFGRTLRGDEAWGVVSDGEKWTITDGIHRVTNLDADPDERRVRPLPNGPEVGGRARQLEAALGRPVAAAVRVSAPGVEKLWRSDGRLILEIPGGFSKAWTATSVNEIAPRIVDGAVILGPSASLSLPRELWALPNAPTPDLAGLSARVEGRAGVFSATRAGGAFVDGVALTVQIPGGEIELGWDWAPIPPDGWNGSDFAISGSSVTDELRALGYVDEGGDTP